MNHFRAIRPSVFAAGVLALLVHPSTAVANGGLNSPYDAKRIGDYTGITPPFDNDHDRDND